MIQFEHFPAIVCLFFSLFSITIIFSALSKVLHANIDLILFKVALESCFWNTYLVECSSRREAPINTFVWNKNEDRDDSDGVTDKSSSSSCQSVLAYFH